LKRRYHRQDTYRVDPGSARLFFVKAVKIVILVAIIVQTVSDDVLPIAEDPFGLRVIGTFLFTLGLATAMSARIQLGANWSDIESAHLQADHTVVSSGAYGLIRHPIYVGDLIMLLGLELALNSWLCVLVSALAVVVIRQAIHEERVLVPGLAAAREVSTHGSGRQQMRPQLLRSSAGSELRGS
jgi:protein-S-isoprenylcysteine O-methyltransferase Ste14